jgi:DNA-binding transcriptional ArsR family regulator
VQELLYIDRREQAEALFKPQRVEVLRQLAEPRSCTEVGAALGLTPQRAYYHVTRLVQADLARQVSERRVRGIHEGIYQASAQSYWLSPRLVGTIGRRRPQDELSLRYLINLVEDVHSDLAVFEQGTGDLPTLAVSGEIQLPRGRRQAFFDDLRSTLQQLFARHGGRSGSGEGFRLAVACYPKAPDHRKARTSGKARKETSDE